MRERGEAVSRERERGGESSGRARSEGGEEGDIFLQTDQTSIGYRRTVQM
jgi:hypothetical protein